jgi:hypothetical protein
VAELRRVDELEWLIEQASTPPDYDAQMRARGWEWCGCLWCKKIGRETYLVWKAERGGFYSHCFGIQGRLASNVPTPTLAADACEEHAKQQEDKA